MTPGSSREDVFIEKFLSAYEQGAWAYAQLTKPDAVDRTNPAVDKLATRPDGRTLAIEHTIIKPFTGDKKDFAAFESALLAINDDQSLAVPGRRIQVFVPVGTLHKQPRIAWDVIAKSVHEWIRSHRLTIVDGYSEHQCAIPAVGGGRLFQYYTHSQIRSLGTGSGHSRWNPTRPKTAG
jgi:hypothetical protein